MKTVLSGLTAAHDASFTFDLADHTPAVINHSQATAIARRVAAAVLGPEQMAEIKPLMAAEDMAEILNRTPGCYLLLGAEPPAGAAGAHHNPRFDFDEATLPLAASLLASLAVTYLQQPFSLSAKSV